MTATLDVNANHNRVSGPAKLPGEHDHTWSTASAHRTSQGTVTYESCDCGAHRVLCAGLPVARTLRDTADHAATADPDGHQIRSRLT